MLSPRRGDDFDVILSCKQLGYDRFDISPYNITVAYLGNGGIISHFFQKSKRILKKDFTFYIFLKVSLPKGE